MRSHALVVFDLDGTLVDSRRDLAASTNSALRSLGLPERTFDEVSSFVGEGARKLIEKSVSPRLELVDPALEVFFSHYSEHLLDETRPYAGIREMLAGIRAPLAVATNKPGKFARRILAGLGLLERFVAVLGGDEGPRKPDPALVDRLRALVSAPREETVLVGDSRVDVATARNAGVGLFAVLWGIGSLRELEEAGAREEEKVASPGELLERLTGA
ncbi:HAD-IA family hydrolase [bacterium]|nr:HAD-IA family hydrolase [bacterium]